MLNTPVDKFLDSVFGLLTIALSLGFVVGWCCIAFIDAIERVILFCYDTGGHEAMAQWQGSADFSRILMSLFVGGGLVGLITFYLIPARTNVGFGGVLTAVKYRNGAISWQEGLGVGMSSAISIGCGASVGRYGPAVHIGAALGSHVARKLDLEPDSVLTILAAGSAAAISASFHAPFAAVLFAHEVILRHYKIGAFAPVTLAAVVGMLVGERHNAGKSVFWYDLDLPRATFADFAVAGTVGICTAGISLTFMQLLDKSQSRLSLEPWLDERIKPLLGALLLAPLLWLQPEAMGLGVYAIQQSFEGYKGAFAVSDMLPMVAVKCVATVLSILSGFNGGVFAPALFMGSLIGACCSMLAQQINISSAPTAVFAMTGMGAMVASVFGAPIFAVIVVLEMTSSFHATTLVLFGVALSYLISNELFAASLWHLQFARYELATDDETLYEPVQSDELESLATSEKGIVQGSSNQESEF